MAEPQKPSLQTTPSKSIIETFCRRTANEIGDRIRSYTSIMTPKHVQPTMAENKHYKRKSTRAGWGRIFAKYSPTTESYLSPIKGLEGNLKSTALDETDARLDLYTWALSMSEQFFYDGTCLLVSAFKRNQETMALTLRRNYVGIDMTFFNDLEDVTLLGKGSYGSVFSCQDPVTKVKYAVKYLSAEFKTYIDHTKNLLDYMTERNSVIRSMDSPFTIKLLYSLQIKGFGALFLFFELCIGNLNGFIQHTFFKDGKSISKMLNSQETEIIQQLHSGDPELLEVCFVYIFELLTALDFLVKCNIIHQDIKPDNIMISSTLHLKIGDFGIAYRTRMLDRETNVLLIKATEIDVTESSNYELSVQGTRNFQEFEQHLMNIDAENSAALTEILNNKRKFNAPNISYDDRDLSPTFLTDTWAAGVAALMLLFRGFEIFNPITSHDEVLLDVPKEVLNLFSVNLVARQFLYSNYIYGGLRAAGGSSHIELMNFLASIFKPRRARCLTYTKDKIINHYGDKVPMKYIDMDKIENIKTFKERNFTTTNINVREIPERIRNIFDTTKTPVFKTFEEFIFKLNPKCSSVKYSKRILNLYPGATVNYII